MSWTTRIKVGLASLIYRHRLLNRWAHKHLPKKRMAVGVMLFDQTGRLLVVKPSYRQDWLIPGGLIEHDESPWKAARRETLEEIGLALGPLRFLAMDWRSTDEDYDDSLHFIFDGGSLSPDQQAEIACDGIEIVDHKFVDQNEAQALLDAHLSRRLLPCWETKRDRPLILNRGTPDPETI